MGESFKKLPHVVGSHDNAAMSLFAHHTKEHADEMAEHVIELIEDLHAAVYVTQQQALQDAARRFCFAEFSRVSRLMLGTALGLATLATYAARLQIASESKKGARLYWSRVVYN